MSADTIQPHILRSYPNWFGLHTRDEAPGAMPNGTRVRKILGNPDDTHSIGSMATIVGSLHDPKNGYGYFVEWDATPRYAIFVLAYKIRAWVN